MSSENRLINFISESLSSFLPKRFSADRKNRDKKKCHADASVILAKKLVFKKERKIGFVDSGNLSYHIISFKGCGEKRYYAINVCDKTGACLNQMVFDKRTAWQITLVLLDVVNENPPESEDRWTGKAIC